MSLLSVQPTTDLQAGVLEARGGVARYGAIAAGFAASQLAFDSIEADGIRLPARPRATTQGSDRKPILPMSMVSIDIGDARFSREGK
jgi:hypothetical protein